MDIFCEYIVKVKRSPIEILISVFSVLVAAILIFMSLALLSTPFSSFVLLIDAAIVYGVYILITHFNVEYEYILTNGELDIDKIIAKRKRKRMFSMNVKEFEVLEPVEQNKTYANILDCSTRTNSVDVYYAIFSKDNKRQTLIFNPPQKMLENMKQYSPRTIHLKGEIY
ncbi:MAG: hypothetical protein E7404_04300 [Ruminococcaceae bacterium]|nr:hypothetical protein [Oscillospiraceae bacterium]